MIIIKRELHTNHCVKHANSDEKRREKIKFLASTNQIFSQYQSILSMSNRGFFLSLQIAKRSESEKQFNHIFYCSCCLFRTVQIFVCTSLSLSHTLCLHSLSLLFLYYTLNICICICIHLLLDSMENFLSSSSFHFVLYFLLRCCFVFFFARPRNQQNTMYTILYEEASIAG